MHSSNSLSNGNSTYKISINKIDNQDKEYVIPNTLIGIHVQAESGENYYKEIVTDENGQINLNEIAGTGQITVQIEELKAAPNYIIQNNIKTITFTRDPQTKQITNHSFHEETKKEATWFLKMLVFDYTACSCWWYSYGPLSKIIMEVIFVYIVLCTERKDLL